MSLLYLIFNTPLGISKILEKLFKINFEVVVFDNLIILLNYFG